MSEPDQELQYWRELALSYERELKLLRERIESGAFLRSPGGWTNEIDRIEGAGELQTTDIVAALDELWGRVAAMRR